MNIRQILKHQIWIDTTLICSSNVQQLHRRRQFISSSSVTYKKNKSKRVSAAESRDQLQTTICCHVIYGFLGHNVSTKYQAHAYVPTFSSLIPFLSILFSLLRLLFLTFSGAPDITYAIHTCTHAQNIIFNNDALRRPSYWLERCLIL